jgi:hypothetical protein
LGLFSFQINVDKGGLRMKENNGIRIIVAGSRFGDWIDI